MIVGMMTGTRDHERAVTRKWADETVRWTETDANRSADTHLHIFPLSAD